MNIILAAMALSLLPAHHVPADPALYQPDCLRIRQGLERSVPIMVSARTGGATLVRERARRAKGDSVWNGVLIGAGVGATGGYFWGKNLCGDDEECSIRAVPAGILAGAGIGAAVGAVLDAFSH